MIADAGKCKTCRYLQIHNKHDIDPVEGFAGTCELTVTTGYHGGRYWRDPGTGAYAEDPYQYGAVLIVSEDFGCVQWREK